MKYVYHIVVFVLVMTNSLTSVLAQKADNDLPTFILTPDAEANALRTKDGGKRYGLPLDCRINVLEVTIPVQ